MSPKRACDWEMLLGIEASLDVVLRDHKLSKGAAEMLKMTRQALQTIMYGTDTTSMTRERIRSAVWAKIAKEENEES